MYSSTMNAMNICTMLYAQAFYYLSSYPNQFILQHQRNFGNTSLLHSTILYYLPTSKQPRGSIFQNGFLGGVQFKISLKKWTFEQKKWTPKNMTFHITWGSIQEWVCIEVDTVNHSILCAYIYVVIDNNSSEQSVIIIIVVKSSWRHKTQLKGLLTVELHLMISLFSFT